MRRMREGGLLAREKMLRASDTLSRRFPKTRLTWKTRKQRLQEQDGRCAICRCALLPNKDAHGDHDHGCPTDHAANVACDLCERAVLCSSCNFGLGHFFESADTLRTAADYVDAWSAVLQQRRKEAGW